MSEPSWKLASESSAPPVDRSYWVVDGMFLAGAYPGSPVAAQHRQRIEGLWHAGLRTFVSLMEETERNNARQLFTPYYDVLQELAARSNESAAHLRFAVRDLSVPTPAVMQSILDAIDHSLKADRSVYLHCFGGVGRTGTVVCCWLLRHGFATPTTVVPLLGQLRRADRHACGRRAPETSAQIEFVESWWKLCFT